MNKSTTLRLAGFVATAGVTAALVGVAVPSTGAYFTDSHNLAVHSTNGTVKVSTSAASLSFDNILPGEYQPKTLSYTAHGTSPEDIWLVPSTDKNVTLPTNSGAVSTADLLGSTADPAAQYGRFAHLEVDGAAGSFSSYNLGSDRATIDGTYPASATEADAYCTVDSAGHNVGPISSVEISRNADGTLPPTGDHSRACPMPGAILLGSAVTNGETQNVTVTFGWTKILRTNAIQGLANPTLTFKIVATQHGISPLDPNN
jgi:hypothetical protein